MLEGKSVKICIFEFSNKCIKIRGLLFIVVSIKFQNISYNR